jgi:hypothetical protein
MGWSGGLASDEGGEGDLVRGAAAQAVGARSRCLDGRWASVARDRRCRRGRRVGRCSDLGRCSDRRAGGRWPASLVGRGRGGGIGGWRWSVGLETAEADGKGEKDSEDAGEAGEGYGSPKSCWAYLMHDLTDPRPEHGVIDHDQGSHYGIGGDETCVKGQRPTVAALEATFSD